MNKGILIWTDVKFRKDIRTCCKLREIFKSIDMSILKKGDIVACLRNISVAKYLDNKPEQSDIIKRAANMGLKIYPGLKFRYTRMCGLRGRSKKVTGLHFIFFPGKEDVGIYLRYEDHLELLSKLPEAV